MRKSSSYPVEGGRSFEESLPEYIQESGSYLINDSDQGLPECPFVLVREERDTVNIFDATIQLYTRRISETAEFEVLYDNILWADERLSGTSLAPGVIVERKAETARSVATKLRISEGMFIVAERMKAEDQGHLPLILRLGEGNVAGIYAATVYSVGPLAELRNGDSLYRVIEPSPPENASRRAVRVATVLACGRDLKT